MAETWLSALGIKGTALDLETIQGSARIRHRSSQSTGKPSHTRHAAHPELTKTSTRSAMWWNLTKSGDQDRPAPGGLAERNIRAREAARSRDKGQVEEGAGARQAVSVRSEAGAQPAAAATSDQPEYWPLYCERCRATGPAHHECIAIAPPPPPPPRALEIPYQARDGGIWVPLQPFPSRAPRTPSQAERAYTPLARRDPRAQRDAPTPASSLWSATPPSTTHRSASTCVPSSSCSAWSGAVRPPACSRSPVGAASPWQAGDGPADGSEGTRGPPDPPPPARRAGSRPLTPRRRESRGRRERSTRRGRPRRHERPARRESSGRHERSGRRPSTARKLFPQRRTVRGPRV